MRRILAASALTALALSLAACGSSATSSPSPQHPSGAPSTASPGFSTSDATMRQTPAPWARPTPQDAYVQAAGLSLSPDETLAVHYHTHLDVLVDGKATVVPAGLGINVTINPDGTTSLPTHGSPGIASLHTHTPDGVLHVEAPAAATFTLGQVFKEWGVYLAPGQVGSYKDGTQSVTFWVNGKQVTTDPNQITLSAHEEIAVVVASSPPAPSAVPSSYAFPSGE